MTIRELYFIAEDQGFCDYQIYLAEDATEYYQLQRHDIKEDKDEQKVWIISRN